MKKLSLALVLFLAVFVLWHKTIYTTASSEKLQAAPVPASRMKSAEIRLPATATEEKPKLQIDAQVVSMQKMIGILRNAYSSASNFEDVLTGMADQTPKIYRDSNPDTGEMLTIRTEKPWAGTRYVNMQYLGDLNSKTHFLQHAAFEFKPGPDSFSQVAGAIIQTFPELGEPTTKTPGYVRWTTKNHYIVWAKVLTKDDISDDPVNAYTDKDLGTVRVVVEKEVHAE